tara:strand:- start:272 stop:973 length:702 start_codon:yes stop_codon:yes gene_type:complete
MKDLIIGNGLIATEAKNSWPNSGEVVIFASGVSDSACKDSNEFKREKNLMTETIRALEEKQCLIYFSTCSIYDPSLSSSLYVNHKLEMEALVSGLECYYIFRLPQVVGAKANGKTLVNHLFNQITTNSEILLQSNARRNLIDVVDVIKLASFISMNKINANSFINLASTRYHMVSEIVEVLSEITKIKPVVRMIDAGTSYDIDTELIKRWLNASEVTFDEAYLKNILSRYYGD